MAMIWWLLSTDYATLRGGTLVGIFMVLAALPSILFVKPIGKLIDSSSSQRILISMDLLACLTVGMVALLLRNNSLGLIGAMGAGFIAACLQATIDPTLNKAVNDVVERQDMEGAVTLLSSTQSFANFSGAVMGAIWIEWIGIWGTAVLASVGYFLSSLFSRLARFRMPCEKRKAVGLNDLGISIFSVYPEFKKILIAFGLVNFFATPTLVVLPIYTKRTLAGSATILGQLEASLWVGLLFGMFMARWLTYSGERVKIGAICLSVFGLTLFIPGFWVDRWLYAISLFAGGAAIGINNVKFMTFFQQVVASNMKGRFFAVMQATIGFTFPIAFFLFGLLADIFSPPQVCLIQGIGVFFLALSFLRLTSAEASLNGVPAVGGM